MKFSTREDVDAPIERVFDMLCSFDVYERAAMRRGADVRRTDTLSKPGLGAQWDVHFMLRGKQRHVTLEVVEFEAPGEMTVDLSSRNVIGNANFELFALSPTRTRMMVACEIKPITLPARLLIQSMKLTKSSLSRKFKERVAEHARDMEEKFHRQA